MTELKRTLGLTEVVFFGVGSILGAGIYTLIGKVAGQAGMLTWLSFLIASLAAFFTAFSYAELSASFPRSGGEYVYAKEAFGKKIGTVLGFLISLNGIISGATVAMGFGGYLSGLLEDHTVWFAMGIALFIWLINISGIRSSSIVNIIFTLIEMGGLLFVIYTAWPSLGTVDYTQLPSGGINGVLAASTLAFFAYVGFEEIVKLAQETRNPEKTIPRALFTSNIIVLIVYGLIALSVVSVIPYETLGKVENPLALVIETSYGQNGIIAISIIALFATSNTILSNMLGSSRVILDMSSDIKALKPFSRIWAKRQTPFAALLLILLIMIGFILIGNIETIALLATLTIFITFIIVNLSAITLRIKRADLNRPHRIPVSIRNIPVFSVLGVILTSVLMIYNVIGLLEH
jgi:APA family basic amino acid/polyamine antiporter